MSKKLRYIKKLSMFLFVTTCVLKVVYIKGQEDLIIDATVWDYDVKEFW